MTSVVWTTKPAPKLEIKRHGKDGFLITLSRDHEDLSIFLSEDDAHTLACGLKPECISLKSEPLLEIPQSLRIE